MKEFGARERTAQRGLARAGAKRRHGAAWPLQRTPPRPGSPANSTRSTRPRRWRPPKSEDVPQDTRLCELQRRAAQNCAAHSRTRTTTELATCDPTAVAYAEPFESRDGGVGVRFDFNRQPAPSRHRRDGPRCSWLLGERSKPKGRDRRSLARGAARERGPVLAGRPNKKITAVFTLTKAILESARSTFPQGRASPRDIRALPRSR